jgi:transcriptional regulator with XRE-family HTH domain
LRSKFSYSQSNLADKLKTKQSVISRFENLGRLPSYDFLTRLSKVYGHKLGITLYGDFMAVVPLEKQELVKQWAKEKNQQTDNYIQELLKEQILKKEKDNLALIDNTTRSKVIEIDFTAPRKSNKEAIKSTQDFDSVLTTTIEPKWAEA